MTLQELKQKILNLSAQYIMGEDIEITDEVFADIVDSVLEVYSQYKPLRKTAKINVTDHYFKIPEYDGHKVLNIEKLWLVDPVKVPGAPEYTQWSFNETSKTLKTLMTGNFYARLWLKWELEDLQVLDDVLQDMILGKFLITLGTYRSNFTLQDLPFENNAEDLKSTGQDLYNNAYEALTNTHQDWWLAID